jgi:hypothetical protein
MPLPPAWAVAGEALRLWLDKQKPSHGELFGLWRDRPERSLELQEALR